MWNEGNQPAIDTKDIIKEIDELPDDLTEQQAKITLAEFLRRNLGYTMEMATGQKLLALQEIIMNGMFMKDYSLIVGGRGFGKSWLIAVFCCLYAVFYPNTKICIVANNFRRSRSIFEQIETFLNQKEAFLLRQCFTNKPKKLNDCLSWTLPNGSVIFALPLSNGEGLRGTRANVLIIDEALLISESIQEKVLRPFLTAKQNVKELIELKEIEDRLISQGLMTEGERTPAQNNKMILMSSASYQFEYLYKIYQSYLENIEKPKAGAPSYMACRISYEAVPKGTIIDDSVIVAAQNGGATNAIFQREYCAMFVDASEGYFNVRNLHDCTVKDGELPTVQIKGQKGAQYLLAIDPSYSSSKSSDFFAMGVYMIVPEERRIVQVHTYGQAGKDLKEHYEYLAYILTNFNIVYTIIDASGTEFVDSFNESVLATSQGLKLQYFKDVDMDADNYLEQVSELKTQWNLLTRTIVYPQKFSSETIRRMNEYLQGGITAKKVWFAGRIAANEDAFTAAKTISLPFSFKDKNGEEYTPTEFLEAQDDWIAQTKRQLALIEVKSTPLGTLQYDIPSHLKKSTLEDRARRDNYTCMLMAYTASKHLFDMLFTEIKPIENSFIPFAI